MKPNSTNHMGKISILYLISPSYLERNHYQLIHVGWRNKHRIYGCVVHLDIKDGKIWIQHNGTEFDIAVKLTEMGIAKQDIVNGFHSSYMRQFTEFAVG